ncbi:molecular chaperone [Serratia fonticola]|uniref:fimbrial biogenesis chaperone n=1 Tax=Serratia fonticola TaxID=47917 RepID=UPI00192D0C25|nr:molecular chaperone [Serratia fonticola]MBL5825952.1 molecular chaperone [Serratia fonticola]
MPRIISLLSTMLTALMLPAVVLAEGFGINATRLIYPQAAESISVTVRNTMATQPYLVQARVSGEQDGNTSAPFLVRPPLFRLEPGSVNQVRILAQGVSLPADRESVFYFHASAIPGSTAPQPTNQQAAVSGTTQFGVGNIIKLFYRPTDLPSSSSAAQKGLQISRVKGGLLVSNPSAYYVSFASLKVGDQALKLDTPEALMLAPFGSHTYATPHTKGLVSWQTINDEGAIHDFSHNLP